MKRGTINLKISYTRTFDKETGCWIFYSKRFNISGYGYTVKEAQEMFLKCCEDALTLETVKG